jgi:hypothetical protein
MLHHIPNRLPLCPVCMVPSERFCTK